MPLLSQKLVLKIHLFLLHPARLLLLIPLPFLFLPFPKHLIAPIQKIQILNLILRLLLDQAEQILQNPALGVFFNLFLMGRFESRNELLKKVLFELRLGNFELLWRVQQLIGALSEV
jgi:hypothetical protein